MESSTSVFSNLLKKTVDNKALPVRMKEARAWVQNQANATVKNPNAIIKNAPKGQTTTSTGSNIIGSMVLFQYEATTAKNLPYWDKFPLVFPFNSDSQGMWGINIHYLPIPLRAKLMDALWNVASGPNTETKTQLTLSYSILQHAVRSNLFQPCVKRYLNTGLSSRLVVIPATEWNIAMFLPLERFQKASSTQVHRDSQRMIRGR